MAWHAQARTGFSLKQRTERYNTGECIYEGVCHAFLRNP